MTQDKAIAALAEDALRAIHASISVPESGLVTQKYKLDWVEEYVGLALSKIENVKEKHGDSPDVPIEDIREREKILDYINDRIQARLLWAESSHGRKALGPGSPTIPGLEDMSFIEYFVRTGKDLMEESR